MLYTLSWFSTLQKPSESAMFYQFEARSLSVALEVGMKWWKSQVDDFCGMSVVPYTIDELISPYFGSYAHLSDERGVIVADLRSTTPGFSTRDSFEWDVRKGVV